MSDDFDFDPLVLCHAYERAIGWAVNSYAHPDSAYYWDKFRAEIYEVYYLFDRGIAIKAGKVYPFSRRRVRDELRKYLRKGTKTPMPLRLSRLRYASSDLYAYKIHDAVNKRVDHHGPWAGVPAEIQENYAVLLIAEPGTHVPGIGFRAETDIFYLER